MSKSKLQHILDTGSTNEQVMVLELEYIQTQINVLSQNHQKLERAILGLLEATNDLTRQLKRMGYFVSGAIVFMALMSNTDLSFLSWKNVTAMLALFI